MRKIRFSYWVWISKRGGLNELLWWIFIIIKLAINMKEPFFSKSPYGLAPGSQQDLKDYTYFDSVVCASISRQGNIWKDGARTSWEGNSKNSSEDSNNYSNAPFALLSLPSNTTKRQSDFSPRQIILSYMPARRTSPMYASLIGITAKKLSKGQNLFSEK